MRNIKTGSEGDIAAFVLAVAVVEGVEEIATEHLDIDGSVGLVERTGLLGGDFFRVLDLADEILLVCSGFSEE